MDKDMLYIFLRAFWLTLEIHLIGYIVFSCLITLHYIKKDNGFNDAETRAERWLLVIYMQILILVPVCILFLPLLLLFWHFLLLFGDFLWDNPYFKIIIKIKKPGK